jgi:hypothetical protein
LSWRGRLKAFLRGDEERAGWGSAVEVGALRESLARGGLEQARIFDEGSQYTTVYARRRR